MTNFHERAGHQRFEDVEHGCDQRRIGGDNLSDREKKKLNYFYILKTSQEIFGILY
jgi:hypothetical protein